jgi:hypothetical protein
MLLNGLELVFGHRLIDMRKQPQEFNPTFVGILSADFFSELLFIERLELRYVLIRKNHN